MKDFRVIDMHCDTIPELLRSGKPFTENDLHVSLKKLEEGRYMAQCFAMFVYLEGDLHPFATVNRYIDKYDEVMAENPGRIRKATTAEEIEENARQGIISAILTTEEGGILEGQLENIDKLYDRGVRMMTLTWNFENELGYPNYLSRELIKADTERGLKPFGFEAIGRMWDKGIIVDVSHLNDAGIYDVLSVARKPIVASHSNCRAIKDFPRNLTDDMILKLRDNGGIMGLNYCPEFISDNTDSDQLDDMVRHVKHVRDLAGIETIALGGDFDGIETPKGLTDCGKMNLLYDALVREGFTQQEIECMFYRNFLRVLKANEVQDIKK
ncbi:MAG: dipeptidase [Erysipelotrichaceae bacterium]|nr:dipeptidase [Erysipelotrichaceae bacterium]